MNMQFVVCVHKEGLYGLSDEDVTVGHVYKVVSATDQHDMIRIIDQSGEDYLYPANCFEEIPISEYVERWLQDTLARARMNT